MFKRNDIVMVVEAAMMARLLRRIAPQPDGGELWQVQFADGHRGEAVIPLPIDDDMDDLDLEQGAWPLL